MVIDLSNIEFENDLFIIPLGDGGFLTLNVIDESIKLDNYSDTEIKRVNLELTTLDSVVYQLSSVIGIKGEKASVFTDYIEYEGAVLTPDNLHFCRIEIYE